MDPKDYEVARLNPDKSTFKFAAAVLLILSGFMLAMLIVDIYPPSPQGSKEGIAALTAFTLILFWAGVYWLRRL